jgi:hypothetical protein
MDCPDCGGETVSVPLSEDLRGLVPGEEPGVALCTRCLGISPDPDPGDGVPDLQRVSQSFPSNPDAAVPVALAVGLLEHLALYRSEVADLLARAERAGSDPLLVLDRLAADPDLDPAVDLAGRRRQLEQLL